MKAIATATKIAISTNAKTMYFKTRYFAVYSLIQKLTLLTPFAVIRNYQKSIALLLLLLFSPIHAYSEDSVTLNLKNADINTLITTISEFTGKNFVIDPRVKGKVTVISKHPMEKKEIYEVFLSILEVHGFTAVPAGEVIKIVPDVKAKQGSIPTLTDNQHMLSDQMVTQIIQVENVAAAQLVPILRPLIPQQGHLAAYPATNVLIISDRASNVDRLMRIISRIDKVSDAKIDVIPLEHAAASEVVRILNSLFQKGGVKGAVSTASRVNLAADERTNSILISGERSARLRYKVLISHLDTPLSTGGNTRVVYLHYVKAKDLAPILSGVSTSIKSPKAKGQIKTKGSEVNIQADETTNALVITAPPDVFRSLQAVISQLDIRRAQVLVEAVIAEVSIDQSRALGIQWAVGDGKSGNTHPAAATQFGDATLSTTQLLDAAQGGTVPALGSGLSMVLGTYTKGGESIAALITALAGDGSTNILSTPSLVTLDNNEAEIIVGENVPFVTGSFTNTGGTTGTVNPFQTIERQDVGLTLRVTPQINEGDAIMLDIQQEISDVVASAAGAADLTTTKRSIKTTVMVEDGQILVLGGLIDDKVTQSEQKVPLLGDIPILGHLFKHTTTTKEKSNTMVFLKPTILRDAATNRNVTNSKYNYIRTQQIEMRNKGVSLFSDDVLPVLPENTNKTRPDKDSDNPQKLGQIESATAPPKSSDFDPINESDDIFD